MGRKVPEPVEHVVAAIVQRLMKEKGLTEEEARRIAYPIAVGRLQDLGYLKKGSLDLTEKGKRVLSKHYKEPLRERAKKIALATKLDVDSALAKLRKRGRK